MLDCLLNDYFLLSVALSYSLSLSLLTCKNLYSHTPAEPSQGTGTHGDAVYNFSSSLDDQGGHAAADSDRALASPVLVKLPGKGYGLGQGQLSAKGGVGAGQEQGLAMIEEERERWGGWLHEHSSSLSRGEDSKYSENPDFPVDDAVQVFRQEEEDA